MSTREIRNPEWFTFFNKLSQEPRAKVLRLQVLDSEWGDQREVEWAPLRGISYDPKEDQIEVLTDVLDHRIAHPHLVFAVESDLGVSSVEVIDGDNRKQILTFKPAQAA